jgi:hypothetical protein
MDSIVAAMGSNLEKVELPARNGLKALKTT